MSYISRLMGVMAETLESMPRLRRMAVRAFVVLRNLLAKIGIGLPRQTPAGLRKLNEIYRNANSSHLVADDPAAPRILILSPRGWATHLLMDTLLAQSLRYRGANVTAWTCGNDMPVCHITNINEAPPMPCAGCKQSQNELLGASGLAHVSSADFADRDLVAQLSARINGMSREQVLSQVSSGLSLGDIVRDAFNWFCLTVHIPKTKQSDKLLRDFLLLAETTLCASTAIFEKLKPDLVIMLNGVFTEESVVRSLCERTGIPYITYERAFGFNQFVFCRNQIANHYDLSQHWEDLQQHALSSSQEQELDHFLENWRQGHGSVVRYWDSPEEREMVIMQTLGIPANTRIITMFTNVVWDTAMFGLDVVFSDMWDWVCSSIRMVEADPGLHLIIRIHPAEVKLTGSETRDRIIDRVEREFEELPDNVSIILPENPISSYKLVALSDLILVYTSTIGLEAAIEGHPVVMCGDTHYRGKGFTFDPVDREEYRALLLSKPGSFTDREEVSRQARRYAHLFFLKHMYPVPIIDERIMGNPRLNIDSLDELKVGNSKELDYLCEFVLDSVGDVKPAALIAS